MTPRRYAVVAGGGTGGHVLPALAVARALAAMGHEPSSIEFVGSQRGQEATLLAGEGFPLTLLPGRGISRRLGPSDVVANLAALAALAWSVLRALVALARWRPRVVVAVGGYASFPAGVAAVALRVPLVVVNVDAVPGRVNRLLGRFAAASAVALPGTPLPRATVTGTPVRAELASVARGPGPSASARHELGLPAGRPTVGVFGGSLGARRINEAVGVLVKGWADRADRAIYHVTGRREWDELSVRRGREPQLVGGLSYTMVPFEERMALLYAAVDVMVCRAGGITVAELAVTGTPSVLVPLPNAPGDHQTANARALVERGAAVLVPDDTCDGPRLQEVLDELLADPATLAAMGAAAAALGHPDAAVRVAELVVAHAR